MTPRPHLAMPLGALALMIGCSMDQQHAQAPKISSTSFGAVDDEEVRLYTIENRNGMIMRVTNYGATVTELWVPDADGTLDDVGLGFDTLDGYLNDSPYFGCVAGRVANRIAAGRFELDGQTYQLATNNGPNHLHGGVRGFDKVVWDAEPIEDELGRGVRFTYVSPDGEEGYPGTLRVTVEYVLTDDDAFQMLASATTDAPTPVNLLHHSYWNLAGHDAGSILDHVLTIDAERYTPTDATYIPTGEIVPVEGTPYDFRTPTPMGANAGAIPRVGEDDPGGYDMNFVVDGDPGSLRRAAVVTEPVSGRVMEIWANQPGIQFYTGNWIAGIAGKEGAVYEKHAGFCLETQAFPDAINRQGEPGWPSVVLRPGQRYSHVMVHRFSTP